MSAYARCVAGTPLSFETWNQWQVEAKIGSPALGGRSTHWEEVAHNPLKDSTQQQQDRPDEKENPQHAAEARRTTPTHQYHSEAESRDDKADKAHRRWVGISLVRISDMGDLGREIELLEELGRQGDVCGNLVERGLDVVRVVRHIVL